MSTPFPSMLMDRLIEILGSRSGFRRDAISGLSLSNGVRDLLGEGTDLRTLLRRAEAGDPAVLTPLLAKILVGETYFFRHPEHFAHLESRIIPDLIASKPPLIRAWSAGCSTGEEAYSIAACLHAHLPREGVVIEVLGTDLSAQNVATAREAMYGDWSLRSLAQRHHLLESAGSRKASVLPHVRQLVRFHVHNLLDPPGPLGSFHLIFCRNVLVYFDEESADRVCNHLVSALLPGGILVLSAMDCDRTPKGLVQLDATEFAVYRKPIEPIPKRPQPRHAGPVRSRTILQSVSAKSEPRPLREPPRVLEMRSPQIAMHLSILSVLEAGNTIMAERLLMQLVDMAPDYIPGLLERALFSARQGRNADAARFMHEVLRRVDAKGPQEPVEGPENLTVEFYRTTAMAFLDAAPKDKRKARG